jgi:hypothetical protein
MTIFTVLNTVRRRNALAGIDHKIVGFKRVISV